MQLLRPHIEKLFLILGISQIFLLTAFLVPAAPRSSSALSVFNAPVVFTDDHILAVPSIATNSDRTAGDSSSNTPALRPLAVDLSVTGVSVSGNAAPGRQFTYFISYRNSGTSVASNVSIVDTLPAGVTYVSSSGCAIGTPSLVGNQVIWDIGAVAPGLGANFTMVVNVGGGVAVSTVLTNVVQIGSSDSDTNPANNVFTKTTTVITPGVDLFINKGVTGPAGTPGGSMLYNITYANNGTDTASNVVITDVLPANVSYISSNAFGHDVGVSGNTVIFTRTTPLSTTLSGSISMRVGVSPALSVGATVTNVVRIGSSSVDANPADNVFTRTTTLAAPIYNLGVSKNYAAGLGYIGTPITYSLSFNTSSNITATNVVLTDTLPTGMDYVSSSGTINNPTPAAIAPPTVNGNQITWNLGSFVPGGSGSISLAAQISNSVSPGTLLSNTTGITMTNADSAPSNNTSSFGIVAGNFCGPDAFGYRCRDDTMPGGPKFNWIDATNAADAGIKADDGAFGPYSIGFSFPYYGSTYTDAFLSSNGHVVFTITSTFVNIPIPNPFAPNNIIAPFWDDLFVCGTSNMYTKQGGTAPNRFFVVEWADVTRFSDSTTHLTFEAILYESGLILFQYQSLTGTLDSATVGIENSTGLIGTQYLVNQSGLVNSRAVLFIPPNINLPLLFLPLINR